ncbi:uncharacterized protein LOC110847719 [Folsomia candida]|uniref:Uncharacterized protein n=1 Tax=Folsomia candida TaxID=158441 RepID=A0A226EKJ9_FOLCA|nr:uncharacterized protein LOC110847719 [Folsomia candida]OXA57106.1 hypothetical protein Fcan01_07067 [Folsomia candida]
MKNFLVTKIICLLVLLITLALGHAAGEADVETTEGVRPTPLPSIPTRIRDSFLNGIRTVGTAIRYVPATLTDFFKNVSKVSADSLRRNTSVVLISDPTTLAQPATTPTKE